MNEQHKYYDHSQLLGLIYQKYGTIAKFCKACKFDELEFLKALAESDLTVDMIYTCTEKLDILPDEVGYYFFNEVQSWRRDPGRPKKEITKTTTPPKHVNYYTITEASNILGVHRHTLQSRLRDGTLKGKLIGKTWRIYRDELFDNSTYLYYFEGEDAIFGDKYLTPSEIDEIDNHKKKGDNLREGDIIAIARNLEVTLYRCDRNKQNQVCVYDCMDI